MKEQHGISRAPTIQQVLSLEKGQRKLPCCNEGFENRCSCSEDKQDEALQRLAEIFVNSYIKTQAYD